MIATGCLIDKLLKSLDVRERKEKVEAFDVEAALEAARSATRAQRGSCGRWATTACPMWRRYRQRRRGASSVSWRNAAFRRVHREGGRVTL
jgi:hypothetical protein